MSHAALVRGDDGGLAVRRFVNAADARAVDSGREVAPEIRKNPLLPGRADWTPSRLGRLIGVSGKTVTRRCKEGLLPFVDQGSPGRPLYRISGETVRMIRIHGLAGVARLRQAGQL